MTAGDLGQLRQALADWLDAEARAWLARTLEQLGHHLWAQQVTQ